jgi:hypothetical protein
MKIVTALNLYLLCCSEAPHIESAKQGRGEIGSCSFPQFNGRSTQRIPAGSSLADPGNTTTVTGDRAGCDFVAGDGLATSRAGAGQPRQFSCFQYRNHRNGGFLDFRQLQRKPDGKNFEKTLPAT